MAITAITSFTNQTDATIHIVNFENQSNNVDVPPFAQNVPCNMWIPWCTSSKDYPGHHIAVTNALDPSAVIFHFFIWQDGNSVRDSQNDAYQSNATAVPGESNVGGNRMVTLNDAFNISFSSVG